MSSRPAGRTCCAGRPHSSRAWAATLPPLLFKAARRLEPLDLGLARETYLSAWIAAMFAGRLAGAGDLLEVSRAARAWGWFAQAAASALWDDDAWRAMLVRQVRLARDAGALDQLPVMLGVLGTAVVWSGDFAAAASLIAEADAVCEATGSRAAPFAAMMLTSLRGDQAEAAPLIEATIAQATTGGQGIAVTHAH